MSLKVYGIATLTRDAEMRENTKGGGWLNFGIATHRNNISEGMQDVDFFEASYYIKNSKSDLLNYMNKGTQIYIDHGEVRADKYEKSGEPKTFFKVHIITFDLLNSKDRKKEEKSPSGLTKKVSLKPAPETKAPAKSTIEDEESFFAEEFKAEFEVDEIPF